MANDFIQKGVHHYENMQDSGVEWIGMIPKSWSVMPAGKLFQEVKEKNVDNQYRNAFSFRYGEIVDKKSVVSTDERLSDTLSNYQIVIPNDIVINGLNLNYDFITQRVAIVREKGIITSAYLCIRSNSQILYPRFAMYLLKAFDFKQVFHSIGSGIRKTLKFQDFKKLPIIYPSHDCQMSIVNYLDRKNEELNEIIEEIKINIREYKAWKSSIIYEAVTKGLNPNVEMKDSGIEWIGQIPAHWSVGKVKQVSEFAPKCDFSHLSHDSLITFTPMECIRNGCFENRSAKFDTISGSYTQYAEGDIVLAKVTPCFENGNICIMKDLFSGLGLGSSELFVLRAHSILTEYLFYYLQNPSFVQRACASMTGTGGLKRVSSDFVKNCPVPIPPKSEQDKIASFLNKRCNAIDALIKEKNNLIEDLESYKKSLIYEVVTGKRKVV